MIDLALTHSKNLVRLELFEDVSGEYIHLRIFSLLVSLSSDQLWANPIEPYMTVVLFFPYVSFQIVPGGAAELDGRLKVGTRILQINSISLIDVTYQEALKVQQSVLDRLHLMVCDGYDPNRLEKDDVGYYAQETIV